jgi:hypothetical protein
MSCCGKGRQPVSGGVRHTPAPSQRVAQPPRDAVVYFEYVGNTGLTVQGRITGKRYRFNGRGARVAVDARDRGSLAGVPRLRQVI